MAKKVTLTVEQRKDYGDIPGPTYSIVKIVNSTEWKIHAILYKEELDKIIGRDDTTVNIVPYKM